VYECRWEEGREGVLRCQPVPNLASVRTLLTATYVVIGLSYSSLAHAPCSVTGVPLINWHACYGFHTQYLADVGKHLTMQAKAKRMTGSPPESVVISKDPDAGNRRFTFVFVDKSLGADADFVR